MEQGSFHRTARHRHFLHPVPSELELLYRTTQARQGCRGAIGADDQSCLFLRCHEHDASRISIPPLRFHLPAPIPGGVQKVSFAGWSHAVTDAR